MTATTFLTQRQLMSKNMPADALTGPYAQQQKMLLYVLPLVFAVGGIAFPIGVLIYWTTSNLWTMGQQFYVIRNNPAPGTPAAEGQGGAGRAQGRPQGQAGPARSSTGDGDRRRREAAAEPAPAPAAQEADPEPAQEAAAAAPGQPERRLGRDRVRRAAGPGRRRRTRTTSPAATRRSLARSDP